MDTTKKVAFLVQYSRMKERMMLLIERKRAYEDDIYGIKATRFTDEPKGGGLPTGLDVKVVRLLSVSEDINKELEVLADKMEYIKASLDRLTNLKYKSVLELKYIDGMTQIQMCSVMSCSRAKLFKLNKKALVALPLEETDLEHIL